MFHPLTALLLLKSSLKIVDVGHKIEKSIFKSLLRTDKEMTN